MKLIIAGTGPGNPELITLSALNAANNADIIIVPRSNPVNEGLAEKIISHHLKHKKLLHINFPMIRDSQKRDELILSQLENLRPYWKNAQNIFFPVIGDSMLYSTGAYLLNVWRKISPELDAEFIPGISAHSLAASCAKRFLAMDTEIFTIIPGTAEPENIRRALEACNSAAIYKPTAINNIHELVKDFSVIRVDFAGIPELERIYYGEEALNNIHEYLSILLLWRN